MPYEFGDVVLVRFPFTNQAAFKQRPACIVSSRAYNAAKPDVIIMAITSQVRTSSTLGEIEVGQWQAANLLKPLGSLSVCPAWVTHLGKMLRLPEPNRVFL
jgi:mRNA interferase MazF